MTESSHPHLAWIALGANLPARASHPSETLERAIGWLQASAGIHVDARSTVHQTRPMGPPQPPYANAVVRVRTSLTPCALMGVLASLEAAAGRVRGAHWGPRTLDLDLLLFGPDRLLNGETVTVPHPGLASRSFVLAPLCELDPDLRHPRLDRSMAELLQALQ